MAKSMMHMIPLRSEKILFLTELNNAVNDFDTKKFNC